MLKFSIAFGFSMRVTQGLVGFWRCRATLHDYATPQPLQHCDYSMSLDHAATLRKLSYAKCGRERKRSLGRQAARLYRAARPDAAKTTRGRSLAPPSLAFLRPGNRP
jgi:hypothetical protein